MLPLILFMACTDPVPVALATCQAVPGLATDAAGLALLEPTLTQRELDALRAAEPTLGLQKVGSEGLARLRAQTTCELVERNDAGGSQWAVALKRTQPLVKTDGSFGDPVTIEFEWHVMDEPEGPRVDAGIAKAAAMRGRLAAAEEEQDLKRVAGLWKAMAELLPDPLLVYDVEEAERRSDAQWVRSQMHVVFDHVQSGSPDRVIAKVSNPSAYDVQSADIGFAFLVDGAPTVLTTRIGPLPAKGDTTASVEVPKGATGNVKIAATAVLLK